jgi:hypothetical protein
MPSLRVSTRSRSVKRASTAAWPLGSFSDCHPRCDRHGLFLGSGFAFGFTGPAVLVSYLIGLTFYTSDDEVAHTISEVHSIVNS